VLPKVLKHATAIDKGRCDQFKRWDEMSDRYLTDTVRVAHTNCPVQCRTQPKSVWVYAWGIRWGIAGVCWGRAGVLELVCQGGAWRRTGGVGFFFVVGRQRRGSSRRALGNRELG
jgi:hypothetical protein